MAKLYYRGMAEENDKPKVGCSARLLGVRPGIDIDVQQVPRDWLDEQGYLKPEEERNPSGEPVTIAIRNTNMIVYLACNRSLCQRSVDLWRLEERGKIPSTM